MKKQTYLSSIMKWIESFNQYASSRYSLNKLDEKYQIDVNEVLSGMTKKQLQVVNSLCAASYTYGCTSTREHIYQLQAELKGEK